MLGQQLNEHRRRSLLTRQDLSGRCGGISIDAIRNVENDCGTVKVLEAVLRGLHLQLSGLPRANSVGEQIRLLRNRKKHSQRKMAEVANLTQASIVNLEKGNGRIGSLYKIADSYNVILTVRDHKRSFFNKGETDSWNTPKGFIEKVHKVVPVFDLDPATNAASHVKAKRMFTESDDGLSQSWFGGYVWLNPPYSAMAAWVEKAHAEFQIGNARNLIALLPARTNTAYFHQLIAQNAHIIFIEKRLKFGSSNQQAPFPSMLVCWTRDNIIDDLSEVVPGTLMRASISHP